MEITQDAVMDALDGDIAEIVDVIPDPDVEFNISMNVGRFRISPTTSA
ncbi:MAG: hypothetical protein SXQ77_01770 [Halobacteria archaeon]|nr:hypothetical protein [Halobacteria archaeon]